MPTNQLPYNPEAEAALLGCLIVDELVQGDILESLYDEDFYLETHRVILAAMKRVFGARKAVDTVTLTDELSKNGNLEKAGGLQTITDLSNNLPSTANYKEYLSIVKRDAMNRSLMRKTAGKVPKSGTPSTLRSGRSTKFPNKRTDPASWDFRTALRCRK